MVETPIGLNRRNRINIKEAVMQGTRVTPKTPTRVQATAGTTDVLRIGAKAPSFQTTVQMSPRPSANTTSCDHQSTYKLYHPVFLVTIGYKPHPVVSDKPILPPDSADNNKIILNVSVSNRLSKQNRKYIDIVSLVKQTFSP